MFDLTREIKLSPSLQKKYTAARISLYLFSAIIACFVLYSILFPTIPLDFSMNNPSSNKNTLVSPRIEQTKSFPAKGIVKTGEKFVFNANPIGNFSSASISFTAGKKEQANIEKTNITIQRSYQAFFYPVGDPIGLKDGSLVTTTDGSYYIVSDGALRKFSNTDIILKLGYPKSSFVAAVPDDLKYNKKGEEVASADSYPNGTLFAIEDTYYKLIGGKLYPFISSRAFLSQFDAICAIAKNPDFLSSHQIAATNLGFADGALGSSAQSVFILSGGKRYPIENADTFNAMGFDWNNVIAMTQDELGAYEQQKQFTHDQPHPDGTIFLDQKTNELFMIKDGFKLPIKTEKIAKTYSKQNPIVADAQSASKESSCVLKKNIFNSKTFSCEISLSDLESLIGNDYQVSANFTSDINLESINASFSTPLSATSMKSSLSKIKERIINR